MLSVPRGVWLQIFPFGTPGRKRLGEIALLQVGRKCIENLFLPDAMPWVLMFPMLHFHVSASLHTWDPKSSQLPAVVLHNVLFHPPRVFEREQPLMGSQRVQ